MKGWKKGLLAALCGALLLMGVAIPASGSSGTVYLMAVNDRVLVDLTAENMPTVMGGVLYVPYTMLSIRDSGINLGVNALYSSIRRTVVVSDGQIGIQFDTQNSTAQDLQGNPVSARAMVRNSMVFLPIDYLCSYFGTISCSRVRTDYGILIRVTNGAVVLRDADLVDAAGNNLAESLRRYQASIETPAPTPPPATPVPTAPPATAPPATAPPVTAPPVTAPPTAAPTVPPTAAPTLPPVIYVPPTAAPSGQPSAPPIQAEVLTAFRWGAQGEEIARLLEERGERALFLFTCEELGAQDDGVRRMAAAGHTVGLALTGEDPGTCAAQLKEGRRLLAEIARYHVVVVSAGGLDDQGREALAREGCAVWTPELRGADFRSGRALVEALAPQRTNYVELECGAGGAAFLRELLAAMDEESCHLRQVTAPLLSP